MQGEEVFQKDLFRKCKKIDKVSLFQFRFQVLYNFKIRSSVFDESIASGVIKPVTISNNSDLWPLYPIKHVIELLEKQKEVSLG